MNTRELAEWIRREHEQVQELANRLRAEVAAVPRSNLPNWIPEVRGRFDDFRAHLVKHMELEEEDGYLPAVAAHRPTLSPQVDQLHHEHTELTRLLDGLHRVLHELTPEDRLLARDCRDRIQSLLTYVDHHEELENNLVTFAFTQDIGVHD